MDEIKNKIIADIKFAQDILGITLISDEWGNKNTKCACALGCVLLVNHDAVYDDPEENGQAIASILDVSEDWVNNFLNGFDGKAIHISTRFQEAWKLGLEIRNETHLCLIQLIKIT